jgi:hypothetical protein
MFEASKALAIANTEIKGLKAENAALRKENSGLRLAMTRAGIEIAQDVMAKIDALVTNNHTGTVVPDNKEEQ